MRGFLSVDQWDDPSPFFNCVYKDPIYCEECGDVIDGDLLSHEEDICLSCEDEKRK